MKQYNITVVPPGLVEVLWDAMYPHLIKVIDLAAGDISEQSIKNRALSGNGIIVVVSDGDEVLAVTTAEVVTYDSGLKSFLIPVLGGHDIHEWGPQWFEHMKALAKHLGCSELRGLAARNGWLRLLKDYGWKESHTVITCKLDEEQL